ncbi:alpha/beta hydrolase [Gordonia araii]|nr:alpha/beta hydrolase [Gordonia araii]NNG97257.1 alpha/beta hydrolase fold domain-containing protein [Gordonia araii NBRC 100433]
MDTESNRSVTVELPRRASWRLVVADVLLRNTVRRALDSLVWLCDHHIIPRRVALWVLEHFDAMLFVLLPPRGTRTMRADFPEFRAEWVWDPKTAPAPATAAGAVLYMHGGGLVTCGLNSHRRIVARLSAAVGLPVLNVEYRQIPRAHVVTSVGDCLAAYRGLLDSGIEPDRIVVAGDSAGGGLAFGLLLAARDEGLPTPGALVAIAPFANYDSRRRFSHFNNRTDSVLSARILDLPIRWGVAVNGTVDPAWSPVNHRFDGFPPTLIQVGSREVLADDAHLLAARCREADVDFRLQEWDRAPHVFHAGADILPDAREAFAEIGRFVRAALRPADSDDRKVTRLKRASA